MESNKGNELALYSPRQSRNALYCMAYIIFLIPFAKSNCYITFPSWQHICQNLYVIVPSMEFSIKNVNVSSISLFQNIFVDAFLQ